MSHIASEVIDIDERFAEKLAETLYNVKALKAPRKEVIVTMIEEILKLFDERDTAIEERLDSFRYAVDVEETTCYTCKQRDICEFAYDSYNTFGDCLAVK